MKLRLAIPIATLIAIASLVSYAQANKTELRTVRGTVVDKDRLARARLGAGWFKTVALAAC